MRMLLLLVLLLFFNTTNGNSQFTKTDRTEAIDKVHKIADTCLVKIVLSIDEMNKTFPVRTYLPGRGLPQKAGSWQILENPEPYAGFPIYNVGNLEIIYYARDRAETDFLAAYWQSDGFLYIDKSEVLKYGKQGIFGKYDANEDRWVVKKHYDRWSKEQDRSYYSCESYASTHLFLSQLGQDIQESFGLSRSCLQEGIKSYEEGIKEIREELVQDATKYNNSSITDESRCLCRGFFSNYYCQYCELRDYKNDMRKCQEAITLLSREEGELLSFFHDAQNQLIPIYQPIYEESLQDCPNCLAYYQLGLISFNQGYFEEALDNIRRLLEAYEKNKEFFHLPLEVYCDKGVAEYELGLYRDAIASLSLAVDKDSSNKNAYFERAAAYFESGEFDQALKDYLASEFRPSFEDEKGVVFSSDYASGLKEGIKKGFTEEFGDNLPVYASMLGVGYWALSNAPSPHAKVVSGALACIGAIGAYVAADQISSEVRDLVTNWDSLSEHERGELTGYLIGKHGIEIFMVAGSVKAMKAYQNLKKANNMLTFETMLVQENQLASLQGRYKAVKKRRNDKEYIRKYFGKNTYKEQEIRDAFKSMGYQIPTKPMDIPDNFITKFADGIGICYHEPSNPKQEVIRIMVGNQNSPNLAQRQNYVIHCRNGRALDVNGNFTTTDNPSAHIPLEEYRYRPLKK